MRLHLLAAAVFLVSGVLAHADTFTTYDLNATLGPPGEVSGSVTGTVTLDETTGMFINSDLEGTYVTTANGSGSYTVPGGAPTSQGIADGGEAYYTDFGIFEQDYFELILPGTSLIGYTGGVLCSASTFSCNAAISNTAPGTLGYGFGIEAGTLTAAPSGGTSVTPEPSSFMLLGTGLLGALGCMRKRLT